jgi:Calcium-activated chloride channel
MADPAAVELKASSSLVSDVKQALPDAEKPAGPVENIDDQFTWDAVMVFLVGNEDKKMSYYDRATKQKVVTTEAELFRDVTADVLARLKKAGLKTDLYYSVQEDEIYCRIGATEERLRQEADRIDLPLELEKKALIKVGLEQELKLAKDTQDGTASEEVWQNVFGKYDQLNPAFPWRQDVYKRYNLDNEASPRYNSLFNAVTRLRLTVGIIEADNKLGGAELSFGKCIAKSKHPLDAFFALHDYPHLKQLETKMNRFASAFQSPLNDIRGYFGEKVAFYFGFLAFYNRMLIIPAIFGILQFVWQLLDKKIDTDGMIGYAALVCIWATAFLEMWKRREAKYRLRWGMSRFEETEQPRPEFKGEWLPSPITGQLEEQFPWFRKLMRIVLSQSVVWTMIIVVIGSLVGVFVLRDVLGDDSTATQITAVANAVIILILNSVYGWVSRALNDYENHRTDSEYENSLIAKTFLFKFVNSYSSLFYIAFIKKHDVGCVDDDCLMELAQQLGSIFVTALIVNNAIEILTPTIKTWLAARANRAEDQSMDVNGDAKHFKQKSPAEVQYELQPYESTFDDFDELSVQYGYVTMFVTAFPLAPAAALFNNIFETRIDSTKLCKLSRRPEPAGAENIGTWYDILNIVSFLAVGINIAIVCFETEVVLNVLDKVHLSETDGRVYLFLITEHALFLIKFAVAYFVPDEPEGYHEHLARQDYVVAVLLAGMEEDVETVIMVDEDDEDGGDHTAGIHGKGQDFDWTTVAPTATVTFHDSV